MAKVPDNNFLPVVSATLEPAASVRRPLAEHREQLECLHEEGQAIVDFVDVAGGGGTEKTSVLSIGIAKATLTQTDESFRSKEALTMPADDVEADGAVWRTLKPNATLKGAQNRHGRSLIAFDTRKIDVSLEVLSVEVYSVRSRSVRALIREA